MRTLSDSYFPGPQHAPSGLSYHGFLLVGFFGIFVPLCAFGWLARAVSSQHIWTWETGLLQALPSSMPPRCEQVINWIALGGGIEFTVIFAVLGVLGLKGLHRLGDALFVTLVIVGMVVLSLLVRTAVQQTHLAWAGGMVPTFEFGFPSTQAANTLALSLVAAVLLWPTRWRWLAVTLGALYVVSVGLAHLEVGLHYPSDILAGWALALAWVSAMVLVRFRFWQRWPRSWR